MVVSRDRLGVAAAALAFEALCWAMPVTSVKGADMATKAPPAAAPQASDWQFEFDEDTRFYSWTGTRGFPATPTGPSGKGWQLYVPISFDATGTTSPDSKWEFQVKSAYVWSNQTTVGQTGRFSDLTDSTAAGTYTYLGLNGIQPYASLALNIPTGRSDLVGTVANARMDPDLVGLNVFGQGWNVGPTLGANIPVGDSWLFGLSAGYTYHGDYTKDAVINPATLTPFTGLTSTLKPGDDFTVTGSAGYAQGAFLARVAGSVTFETNTDISGILLGVPYNGGLYRSGNAYLVSALASYDWSQSWSSVLAGAWAHTDRNNVLFADLPPLVSELFDSNTDVYQVTLDNKFQVGSDLIVGPTVGFLDRTNNSWVSTSNQYIAAKTKWTAGVFGTYNLFKDLALNGRVEHYWIHQGTDPGLLLPALADNGWLASLGASYTW